MRISTKEEHEYIETHATIKERFKDVSKQEFDEFIASYPRYLERDVCVIYEPPEVSYDDREIGWWSRSIVASTMLYSDDPKSPCYEPEDKRVYRIVTNYEDLRKESQMLLEKYGREQFRKVLKDKFIDLDEDDYEAWLEEQCRAYARKISQLEGVQNSRDANYKSLLTGFHLVLRGMIQQAQKSSKTDISKINTYKDCLLKFEGMFGGKL